MPSLKILCLHGAGAREDILKSQMRGLTRKLEKDNSATFVYVGGELSCGPGPGIEHVYEGPYYSYHNWPRRLGNDRDDEQSVQQAYELLYDIIATEGPFDGILGFSHGATLAFAFLAQHAREHPYEPMPVRCALFFSAMPPFRLATTTSRGNGDAGNEEWIYDDQDALRGTGLRIPTVHVVGKKDFVLEHSLKLHALCDPVTATLVMHSKGHEIPGDKENVGLIERAVRELGFKAMFG